MKKSGQNSKEREKGDGAGKAVGIVALTFAASGLVFTFFGAGASVFPGALGAALGVLAYALGSRRVGPAAIFVSVAVMFFGLAASQGLVPGLEATDHSYPEDVCEPGEPC
jgi:hypothetical protein